MVLILGNSYIHFFIFIRLGFIAQSSKSSENKIDFLVKKENNYIGDNFKDKDIIIVDDIINTGETICSLTEFLKKEGSANVYSFIYHDLLKNHGENNIHYSQIENLVSLNTIDSESKKNEKIIKLSVSKILSKYLSEILEC